MPLYVTEQQVSELLTPAEARVAVEACFEASITDRRSWCAQNTSARANGTTDGSSRFSTRTDRS